MGRCTRCPACARARAPIVAPGRHGALVYSSANPGLCLEALDLSCGFFLRRFSYEVASESDEIRCHPNRGCARSEPQRIGNRIARGMPTCRGCWRLDESLLFPKDRNGTTCYRKPRPMRRGNTLPTPTQPLIPHPWYLCTSQFHCVAARWMRSFVPGRVPRERSLSGRRVEVLDQKEKARA